MIYDIFTFNGEYDMLEIRLNVLNEFVDEFILVEAPTTFSGQPKPLYYRQEEDRYVRWAHKITYHVIDENYTAKEIALAESSPNTQGASHWKHEFLQKESIKKALTHLFDDDICFIGDVDEIWRPVGDYADLDYNVAKMKLQVYSYYLNNLSSEEFWGTISGRYGSIKNHCLNHLRVQAPKTEVTCGWHFTSMGGYEEVKRKLSDSYTRESYWTPQVEAGLKDNIENGRDFLGRDFTYVISEFDLPKYLLDNKQQWSKLFL